jgi:hypothetical protein
LLFKNQKPRSNTAVQNYSSDTSPFHSRRQEQPEDLPTGKKTPTPDYEQQWASNTIQTIIMIFNAKGIPNAIAQKL